MGTVSVGFPRVWYFLIKSMTEVNESTLSSSAEEGTQDGPTSRSLGEDGQKRASSSDVGGRGLDMSQRLLAGSG